MNNEQLAEGIGLGAHKLSRSSKRKHGWDASAKGPAATSNYENCSVE